MNNQEAFNRVWQYFIIKKHPKNTSGYWCKYFTPETKNKCAVGCMMSNKMALRCETYYAGTAIIDIIIADRYIRKKFADVDIGLLTDLQQYHDNSSQEHFSENFEFHLRSIAKSFKLTIPTK